MKTPREKRKGISSFRTYNRNRNRTVYLFRDIDEDSSQEIIEELEELDTDKKKRPITIRISSPGGLCSYGFAVVDTIEKLKCPTKAVAMGDVCSMAPLVFVACDERIIYKHSFIMLHPVFGGAEGDPRFMLSRVKNTAQSEKMYDDYFLSKTTMPKRTYMKHRTKELWLTAEEAVKYGIAHKIL